MDKIIRLDKFDVSSADLQASKFWRLWYHNFTYCLSTIAPFNPDKLWVLYLNISATVADIIEGCSGFEHAIELLKAVYDKPPNVIYARHLLSTCLQQKTESEDQYLQALNCLATDCCFRDVTVITYRDESVRGAFICGLWSSMICARLLENDTLNFQETTQCARALEQAHLCVSHMPLRLVLLLRLKMCLLILSVLSLLLLLLKTCSLILVWNALPFFAIIVLPAIRYVETVANSAILPKFAILLNRHSTSTVIVACV